MKDYEKLLEYLINIVKIAKDSNGNIFQIKENSYTKKENSFMEYKLKEKTVSRNINNDRVFPVDNQTLDEFYNETEMNLDYAIIHTGSYADELTRSLHTLALTVGEDIYFRNKAYKPETEEIKPSPAIAPAVSRSVGARFKPTLVNAAVSPNTSTEETT